MVNDCVLNILNELRFDIFVHVPVYQYHFKFVVFDKQTVT